MKMFNIAALVGAAALTAVSLPVSAQTVNFDDIPTFDSVNDFYAGGTSSSGVVGPDYGIVFETDDWTTTTAFGQTSAPNLAYSESGAGYVNFLNGITEGLNFSYGGFSDTTFLIYADLNGTGELLASYVLATNDPFSFDFVALPFAGVAHSIQIRGGAGQFGWDDITFGSLVPDNGVPEPATWAMMIAGFGLAGGALRRRAKVSVSYAA